MTSGRPFRVLFLCTGNSARSQMAEAVLNLKAGGRFQAESAGSHPAAAVNPFALEALRDLGMEWQGHQPRGLDGLVDGRWDLVVTVCDSARDACPVFPGQSVTAHWGMPDPAAVDGSEPLKRAAFGAALQLINRRIARLVALPVEQLERAALAASVREIADVEQPLPGMLDHPANQEH